MEERKLKLSLKNGAPLLFRPIMRRPAHVRRDSLTVRDFVRALTRFQPRTNVWPEELPAIKSCVSEECRRLNRFENVDFVMSPRSPHSEFRPRSAHPDCQKEFVTKTNICFGSPAHKFQRRSIKSAPPSTTRAGRFEHNILQEEYYELHGMLRKAVEKQEAVEDIVARPPGIYSHRYPSTSHRIYCLDEHVGMGYFKRCKKVLVDNLSLDIRYVEKRHDATPRENGHLLGPEVQLLLESKPMNLDSGLSEQVHQNNRRRVSSCASVSTFNSTGEIQTVRTKPSDTDDANNDNQRMGHPQNVMGSQVNRDACTSTADDRHLLDADFVLELDVNIEGEDEDKLKHQPIGGHS